jgi:hypothetical protein
MACSRMQDEAILFRSNLHHLHHPLNNITIEQERARYRVDFTYPIIRTYVSISSTRDYGSQTGSQELQQESQQQGQQTFESD